MTVFDGSLQLHSLVAVHACCEQRCCIDALHCTWQSDETLEAPFSLHDSIPCFTALCQAQIQHDHWLSTQGRNVYVSEEVWPKSNIDIVTLRHWREIYKALVSRSYQCICSWMNGWTLSKFTLSQCRQCTVRSSDSWTWRQICDDKCKALVP